MGKFRAIVHEIWDPPLPARRAPKPRKLSRCERRTAELLIELGPPADMTREQRDVLNTVAGVCRACGHCPAMQRLSVMTRDP